MLLTLPLLILLLLLPLIVFSLTFWHLIYQKRATERRINVWIIVVHWDCCCYFCCGFRVFCSNVVVFHSTPMSENQNSWESNQKLMLEWVREREREIICCFTCSSKRFDFSLSLSSFLSHSRNPLFLYLAIVTHTHTHAYTHANQSASKITSDYKFNY